MTTYKHNTPVRNNMPRITRSYEVREYLIKLKSYVGSKPYKYSDLPTELRINKLHRKLTDNKIALRIDKSSSGHTWMLIY